ncbi:polyphosphate polymerase domain-containing protein [Micromonospora peucetia]|uniref:VTC domain-containing protein n=1 Tax=Micromonospora peucetia TaxID=47871 RepID=A0A1C6VXD4_9ACTN|nr:polyphosphate polymerase domain-containing protein [Micromonospora peucetia]MCX4387820.1 polyphosphate polymerase domain-containing protein [Micromonospora peucetia]SCL70946.1 VTC domain-containing protein [Micromonospora peucetia]
MRLPFRARPAPPDAVGGEPPAPGPRPGAPDTPRDADRAGHALRAPSRLHAFNRYEIKYLVDSGTVRSLRDEFARRMDLDSHGGTAGYGVWSVYYDTARLRFYWEKIEGLRFRRKLRIRHYGDHCAVTDDTTVYVEIKQRVNRVTQKRRIALPYRLARELCDRRVPVEHDESQRAFVEEVLELVSGLDLRPVAMTGYQREAFVGRDADAGLRVTLDHRVRGRDRDFHLGADAENRLIVPARLSVVEIKANERVPYWLTDLAARSNMSVVRMSKYCQSVEAFGRAPRSVFHVVDDDPAADLSPVTVTSEA